MYTDGQNEQSLNLHQFHYVHLGGDNNNFVAVKDNHMPFGSFTWIYRPKCKLI